MCDSIRKKEGELIVMIAKDSINPDGAGANDAALVTQLSRKITLIFMMCQYHLGQHHESTTVEHASLAEASLCRFRPWFA